MNKDINSNIFGPIGYNKYLKENDIPNVKTAENISMDSYEKLNKDLRENSTMILRLGKANESRGMQFALIKVKDVKDYFLIDEKNFTESGQTYLPTKSIRDLFEYQVFSFLSESSFVNLGVVSGLISRALGLDEYKVPLTPATGKSTCHFEFCPYSQYKDILFNHNNGQVEIDGVLVAERGEKQTVFVLEAKSDRNHKSLAKHKLVYPFLALAKKVPRDMPMVPVYIKVFREDDGIHYHVLECHLPDTGNANIAINELKVKKYNHLVLPILNFK